MVKRLSLASRLAVGPSIGLVEVDFARLERRVAGAGLRHEAERHGVDERLLLAGEAVALLLALRVGRVAVEPRDLHVAVGLVLDEPERPGADEVDLAGVLGGLLAG